MQDFPSFFPFLAEQLLLSIFFLIKVLWLWLSHNVILYFDVGSFVYLYTYTYTIFYTHTHPTPKVVTLVHDHLVGAMEVQPFELLSPEHFPALLQL